MAISFSCECGQEFKVSESHAGKRIKCQGCGSAVKIPALPTKAKKSTSDSGGVAVGKVARKSKRAEDEEEDPLVHSTSSYDSAFEFDIAKVPMGKLIEDDDPDSPKSKKKKKAEGAKAEKARKKKKDDEEAANPLLVGVFLLLGLCSLSALGYFGLQKFGGAADTTPVEKKFVTFKHETAGWSVEHPDDWPAKGQGGSGGAPPLLLMEGDGAIFRIKGSLGGSAVGSIAQSGGAGGIAIPGAGGDDAAPVGEDLSPETAVHEFQKTFFEADYSDYQEEPMKKITTPFGEGRLSVYTGSEGLIGGKVKGYRATFMDNNWQYNIRAYVPENQWEKFEPMFKRMIMSFSR